MSPPIGIRCPAFVILMMLMGSICSADIIHLKSGGEVRGVLRTQQSADGAATMETLAGTTITIAAPEIDFLKRRNPLIEEYVTRSRKLTGTIEEHWELAEWCRTKDLKDQRHEQLEVILELDANHPDARRVLGYQLVHGRWMTKEDEMLERGYIRHKNKWVTRQELALIEANTAQQQEEAAWTPKVRQWTAWMTGSDPRKASTALKEFSQITDPDAIAALKRHLSQHQQDHLRMLFVTILGKMDGERTVVPLVERILTDESDQVRLAAMGALKPEAYPLALPLFTEALKSKANPVVCRAAFALGEMRDRRAIPALINALVTVHPVQMQVPASQPVTFSTAPNNSPFSGNLPPDVEIASRTGQLPYGVGVRSEGIPQQMRVVTVLRDVKNVPVLEALQKVTGQNLGFNERDWHIWWAVNQKADG
ncbi:HEAT repeat domain-containing protein [Planctomicrobium sp. SH668]|uniref:HEAT repeat domain-containing protein n=1 Tax=Planctomicrobium sp. SH668 TaxID=3448126 RepID=UPI003F5CBB94